MHRTISNKLPRVAHIYKTNTPATYITTRNMSFFPRAFQDEFATFQPLFRLADDYSRHVQGQSGGNSGGSYISRTFKSFTPKVDVKENQQNYEIHAELPGIQQKDINIEFTDSQTLTIKGRTEHVREEGTRPSGFIEGSVEQGKLEDSNKSHQPTVEDEGASGSTEVQKSSDNIKQVQQQQQAPKEKYWVSERSVGEFARTFSFPARVDQDNVKASLKDGILSVVVPKAPAPTTKKISIE
ncbi:Putative small heat shock protein RTM2 [Septoria linicola]|uniref:Small heat shock protein RTM2 n=1 Tax=Septoria linicola TaxID=215465 RepID=A0A9Q9B328_9PEZI|nr:Putative small heat shock protein RTM2 [Septoria linicola]